MSAEQEYRCRCKKRSVRGRCDRWDGHHGACRPEAARGHVQVHESRDGRIESVSCAHCGALNIVKYTPPSNLTTEYIENSTLFSGPEDVVDPSPGGERADDLVERMRKNKPMYSATYSDDWNEGMSEGYDAAVSFVRRELAATPSPEPQPEEERVTEEMKDELMDEIESVPATTLPPSTTPPEPQEGERERIERIVRQVWKNGYSHGFSAKARGRWRPEDDQRLLGAVTEIKASVRFLAPSPEPSGERDRHDSVTLCEQTGLLMNNYGECPEHGGDACLADYFHYAAERPEHGGDFAAPPTEPSGGGEES